MLLNGPESFTPDGNFILGEAPELRRFFVAAGFNSAGIANSGGAGRLIAEWIVAGERAERPRRRRHPPLRRRSPANKRALAERTGETLGLHYAMRWPRQELETARPLRTSPLYDLLAAKGAVFGAKNGWERANYFRAARGAATPRTRTRSASPAGCPTCVARAARDAARRSRSTTRPRSARSCCRAATRSPLLQRLCANEMDVAPGRMVYTPMLNERGGFESDVTVTRLAADRFLIVTGSAQTPRDLDWIARQTRAGEFAALTDVSGMTAVLSLMGPNARDAARPRRRADTFDAARPEQLSSRRRARSTSASRASAPRA